MAETTFKGYEMHLKIKGANFPVKDSVLMGGKADPYIRLWTGDPRDLRRLTKHVDKELHTEHMGTDREGKVKLGEMHSSGFRLLYDGVAEAQKNTLDPNFPTFKVQVDHACIDSDITSPIKSILIEFWDFDGAGMRPDFMGFIVIAPCQLCLYNYSYQFACDFNVVSSPIDPSSELLFGGRFGGGGPIPLVKGAKGHTWSGSVQIENVKLMKGETETPSSEIFDLCWKSTFDRCVDAFERAGLGLLLEREQVYLLRPRASSCNAPFQMHR